MQLSILLVLIASVSAATLISVSTNYTISYQKSYDELAHIYYDQKLNQHGMNYLYVYGNSLTSLVDQHRGAGFLEGYATYLEIHAAYINFNKFKINEAAVKPKLQTFLSNQIDFIQAMAERFTRDSYWQYAYAYLQQCRYAYKGFLRRIHEESRLDLYIGFSQFYYLTNVGDLRELLPAYNTASQQIAQKSCTIFIKKTDEDIYVSHSTGSYYPYMIRIVKSYNFPSRDPAVVSQTITFSSRPGDFSSKDSYYITSSGLKITETSFSNFNKDNFAELNPKSVPSWIRANLAATLSKHGNQWVDYYSEFSSGTHSAQWIIIDHTKFYEDKGLVLFYEQAFTLIKVTDVTPNITKKGYVASYNVPLDLEIYNKLQFQYYDYTYETDPSAVALRRYNSLMNNQEQIKYWMYINEEKDPSLGIAPRGDLATPKLAFGLIDCKVSSLKTDTQNYFWMRSSPTTSNKLFPPFTWKTFPNISHEGMPTQFNFDWQKVPIDYEKWIQQNSQNNLMTQ